MRPAIEIHRVSKTYPGKKALSGLNLTVPRGSVFALLGDNGAGKSTTIRILNGLTPADHGEARVLGHDAWHDAWQLRQHIGYVPERPKFYDWMTVSEIGWFTSGFQKRGYLQRYHEWTERFLLEPRARLSTLSKGHYAKVGLAGQGRTILISSHQVAEIERVASHVAFLAKGKVLLAAAMTELRDLVTRVRFRCDGAPPQASYLGTVLDEQNVGGRWQLILREPSRDALDQMHGSPGIREFEEMPLNLEEIYCALLGKKESAP
jgi:ABC-2 type transport system ATP-binding protein